MLFRVKEKNLNYTGYFLIGGFQIYLENSSYSTENKDIIKVLKADDRFIGEKKEPSKREKLIAEANKLELEFANNISDQKLQELIDKAKAKSDSDNNSTDQPAN